MRDYSSHITLANLVQLTSQFLAAVQGKLEEQDCKTQLKDNLNPDQSERMRELVEDWGTLNAQVEDVINSGVDFHRMDPAGRSDQRDVATDTRHSAGECRKNSGTALCDVPGT